MKTGCLVEEKEMCAQSLDSSDGLDRVGAESSLAIVRFHDERGSGSFNDRLATHAWYLYFVLRFFLGISH